MRSRRLALPLLAAIGTAALLAGCTTAPQDDDSAHVSPPEHTVTTAAASDAATRAIEVSRALFESSPVAVVANSGDAADVGRAAEEAVRRHAPVLIASPGAGATGTGATSTAGDASSTDASSTDASSTEATSPGEPSTADATDTAQADDAADDLAAELDRLGATRASSSDDDGDDDAGGTLDGDADTVAVATSDPGNAAAVATARAAGVDVHVLPDGVSDLQAAPDVLDALGASSTTHALLIGAEFAGRADLGWSVAAARTDARLPGGSQRLFPDHRFVAIYGAPGAPSLGVLGEQDVAQTIDRAKAVAAEYQPYSDRPVVPMLEIIATVAAGDAGADGDYSNELAVSSIEPYVDAAADAGVYVVLDLQPGRSDFLTQAKLYESLLTKPNVGLALDAEWRLGPDQVPLRQIGSVSADEVNATSAWLADLVAAKALPPKMFVLHQFRLSMLQDRSRIDTTRPELETLIHADGQGSQPDKQATWNALHVDAPAGIAWGWKNFYDEDKPMLTPEQTMTGVSPVPDLVTYQ